MPFHFKQFTIHQDKCAMKVGTDGVLLGAWTFVENNPTSVLDIGTGSGLIALQLAQRCDAELIDAVEIDAPSYEQAVANFENSSWGNRLFCYHATLDAFTSEMDELYDLIVSNPPFYTESLSLSQQKDVVSEARKKARFTSSLSFDELLFSVSKLLSEKGIFSVIVPFKEESSFVDLAKKHHLFLNRLCRVRGNPTVEVKRSLLEFSFCKSNPKVEHLTIEINRHQYTKAYIALVKDFYNKM